MRSIQKLFRSIIFFACLADAPFFSSDFLKKNVIRIIFEEVRIFDRTVFFSRSFYRGFKENVFFISVRNKLSSIYTGLTNEIVM